MSIFIGIGLGCYFEIIWHMSNQSEYIKIINFLYMIKYKHLLFNNMCTSLHDQSIMIQGLEGSIQTDNLL